MEMLEQFYQENKTYIFAAIIIIVCVWLFYQFGGQIIKKERYELTSPVANMKQQQVGQTDTDVQMMDLLGAEARAQINVSGNITREMEKIQEEQIHNSEVNQNTNQTQQNNQMIAMEKIKSIGRGGMAKKSSPSEVESNIIAASNSYKFDEGEVPPIYSNIFDQKQNTTSSIINSTVILNPGQVK